MYSALINPDDITPLFSTLPAMFAKSSMIWSTLLYLISNKHIKEKLTWKLFLRKNSNDYEVFNMEVETKIINFNYS